MSIRTHHVVPLVAAGVIAAVLSASPASAAPTPDIPQTCSDPVRFAVVCDPNDPAQPAAVQTCSDPVHFAVICDPPYGSGGS